MRVHAQQLSLLELDEPPKVDPRSKSRPPRRPETTRDDTRPDPRPTPSDPRPHADVDGTPTVAAVPAAPTLLTTHEAAELLHVHPRTVQRLVERGQLAAVHLGSAVRFDPDDLGGLISGHKRGEATARPTSAERLRCNRGARVSFADRLRSEKHEHRAAHA